MVHVFLILSQSFFEVLNRETFSNAVAGELGLCMSTRQFTSKSFKRDISMCDVLLCTRATSVIDLFLWEKIPKFNSVLPNPNATRINKVVILF